MILHLRQHKRKLNWRQDYKIERYLQPYTKEDLLNHGKKLLGDLAPHYLEDKQKLSKDKLLSLREKWSHFIEEVSLQEINLREFASKLDGDSAQLWAKAEVEGMFNDDLDQL